MVIMTMLMCVLAWDVVHSHPSYRFFFFFFFFLTTIFLVDSRLSTTRLQ